MQIHELTKIQKTNEGILDGVKDAISVAKTGYKQGGLKGAAKATFVDPFTNPAKVRRELNKAKNDRLQKDSLKGLEALKKQGIEVAHPLSFYVDQVSQNPQDKSKRQGLDAEFNKTFDIGPVLPDPNNVLIVNYNRAEYYKTEDGRWFQEPATPNGQARQIPTGPSTQPLEAMIDQDQYSQIGIPPSMLPPPAADKTKTQPKQPTAPAQAKQQVAPPQQPVAPAQQPAAQQKSPMAEARQVVQKGSLAKQAMARNVKPGVATQPKPAQSGTKPTRMRGKKKLRTDFNSWIGQFFPGLGNLLANDREIANTLNSLFNKMVSVKTNPSAAVKLFDKYVLTIQAGLARAKAGGTGQQADQQQEVPQNNQGNDLINQLRQTGMKSTGNPEHDRRLQSMGINILKETKDLFDKLDQLLGKK